jgi:7-cyano-7-deazaguanine synthase
MNKRAVVIFSGGMDSYTVLNKAVKDGFAVFAVTFNYGQRHSKEIDYAKRACSLLGVKHKVVDITQINQLLAGSSLTSDIDMPEGHYAGENMKSTVVPNRNMILLSLAVGYAVSINVTKVFYGAHSGDHEIYPDCRPEFVEKMNAVCAIANYESVEIVTPYLNNDKIGILSDGIKMGLDYGMTWTC